MHPGPPLDRELLAARIIKGEAYLIAEHRSACGERLCYCIKDDQRTELLVVGAGRRRRPRRRTLL